MQADIARASATAPGTATAARPSRSARPVSFRATTSCCTTRYVSRAAGSDDVIGIDFCQRRGAEAARALSPSARGLGSRDCYSFESAERPGSFIRHAANGLVVNKNDGSKLFSEDATFCIQAAINGQGATVRSWSQAARYWRHYDARVHISYPRRQVQL